MMMSAMNHSRWCNNRMMMSSVKYSRWCHNEDDIIFIVMMTLCMTCILSSSGKESILSSPISQTETVELLYSWADTPLCQQKKKTLWSTSNEEYILWPKYQQANDLTSSLNFMIDSWSWLSIQISDIVKKRIWKLLVM